MAAALACGLDSLVSHANAGALWGFLERPPDFHVSSSTRRRRPGIVTHIMRDLHPDDSTVHEGIPVTGPARTLLDLAAVLSPRHVSRAYEEADRMRLIDERSMRALLTRASGHHGVSLLTALVEESFAHAPTKLELERSFYELCRAAGLPLPLVNVWVEGRRVDACWPQRRLVVELDSKTFHRTDGKVERDYDTSAELTLAGHAVLRFTWKQVTRKPDLVLALVRQALS